MKFEKQKHIRFLIRSLFTLMFLIIAIQLSFGQNRRQVADFKVIRKSIDSLLIIPTYVDIKAIDSDNLILGDTLFAKESSDKISRDIKSLLDNKYVIQLSKGNYKLSPELETDLRDLYGEISESEKTISNISIPNTIIALVKNSKQRYCVLNFYGGHYKTKARIKQEEKELLPKSIGVAILTLGSVYLTPASGNLSIMKTILFDKIDRKLIFYKESSIAGSNPRSYVNIVNYISSNFKPLYYK